jgi:hypothetical protein
MVSVRTFTGFSNSATSSSSETSLRFSVFRDVSSWGLLERVVSGMFSNLRRLGLGSWLVAPVVRYVGVVLVAFSSS